MVRGSQRCTNAPRGLQRRVLPSFAAVSLAVTLAGVTAAAAPGASASDAADTEAMATAPTLEVGELREPHFGTVLFHYYQDDHFGALTRLLAHRDAGRISAHEQDAALLSGGLYLQYGLHARAEQVFEALLADHPEPKLRNHAWFELGRVRYRQGEYERALDAFRRIDAVQLAEASPDPERRTGAAAQLPLLMAQCELALGRHAAAAERLERWEGPQHWLPWMRYNLGVALIRQGRDEDGFRQLEQVGAMAAPEEEDRALRDRANLALGYAWLQRSAPDQALPALLRVRLEGPSANRALLGLGWARSAQDDHAGALVPWELLQERDGLDSAIHEARLAVPHALARMSADTQAARAYEDAVSRFDAQIARLDGAAARAGDEQWLQALLQTEEADPGRWRWQLEALPETEASRWLGELIAGNAFQEGLRNYRDLLDFGHRLDGWAQRIDAFGHMVDTRSLADRERGPAIAARLDEIDPMALRGARDGLAARLERIAAERDVVALATGDEAFQWQLLEELGDGPALAAAPPEARDRYRLLRGHLLWQLDREYRYRLWQQQRTLDALDAQLAELGPRLDRVLAVHAARPGDVAGFAERIDALGPRIAALQAQVDATRDAQVLALQEQALDWLGGHRERLVAYRVQAQFALATLLDRAATARSLSMVAPPDVDDGIARDGGGSGAPEFETGAGAQEG